MKKEITLGDIAMYEWKKGDPLFPEWYFDDEEEKDKAKIDPKEVILEPNTEYLLIISYPLSRNFEQKICTNNEGMTREDFVELVVLCYKKIYEEEDETSSIEAGHISGMYNRVSTDGDYGIWGHDLSDLILCTLHIKNNELTLGVDS